MQQTKDTRQLTWLLAWAVVFCDIGTSVYYVPGILYGNVGDNTPFFVLLTTIGFIPLALKYIEISWRNPEGGGVVSITTKALGPMWGCLGGMLITGTDEPTIANHRAAVLLMELLRTAGMQPRHSQEEPSWL